VMVFGLYIQCGAPCYTLDRYAESEYYTEALS